MRRVAFVVMLFCPIVGSAQSSPDFVEKLIEAYRVRNGLALKDLQPWPSVLAPQGRVFRYKLSAVAAKDKQGSLEERFAFVFIDPDSGNVYDVKQTPGEGSRREPADRRLCAILRLMGARVRNEKQAEAFMADVYRVHSDMAFSGQKTRFTLRMDETRKGETWAEPAMTYIADHSEVGRFVMKVDEEGYVTEFYTVNLR